MIDSILKYLSLITLAGAAVSFAFGFIKYMDQRNREERTKRFELFHGLMRRVSARGDAAGEGLPLTQQLAAIYELQQFNEYAYASIPILEHLRTSFATSTASAPLLTAIDSTIAKLRQGYKPTL
ncbi:MAG: hypothetical protein PSV26_12055 [Polaromonas sp.]|uniref:hypothetical protein n=1 Tax=Polaromonas sp. TaxID=1869339 RepID=UPI002489EBA9|nr:hypothetical protein [Polaromonas sp.]MDI1238208.1 hypothetical protein [Polaromonas sp.]